MLNNEELFWKNKRILVTGATGLIGSWLVNDLLKKGAKVVVFINNLNRPSELYLSGNVSCVTVFEGSIENFSTVEKIIKKNEFNTIFHLASTNLNYGYNFSPLSTFETNIRGTYNLLEACRLFGNKSTKIVVVSSMEACNDHNMGPNENNITHAYHPYEASKKCVEIISQAYQNNYSINISIVRCPNTYGGGDFNWDRLIPGTIRSVLRSESPIIRSDGTLMRSYIYVLDLVEALLLVSKSNFLQSNSNIIYNFEESELLSSLEIVKNIINISNQANLIPIIKNYSKDEKKYQKTFLENTVNDLGWVLNYNINKGLSETFKWYSKHIDIVTQ